MILKANKTTEYVVAGQLYEGNIIMHRLPEMAEADLFFIFWKPISKIWIIEDLQNFQPPTEVL